MPLIMKKHSKIVATIFTFVLTTVFFSFSRRYSSEEETIKELKGNFLNPSMDW